MIIRKDFIVFITKGSIPQVIKGSIPQVITGECIRAGATFPPCYQT